MKAIWKFPVRVGNDAAISMPKDAWIVHLSHQRTPIPGMAVTFWALVEPDAEREIRTFRVYGTGHLIEDGWHYVGTDCAADNLVWHLFEADR